MHLRRSLGLDLPEEEHTQMTRESFNEFRQFGALRGRRSPKRIGLVLNHCFIGLLGFFSSVSIRFIGELYVTEICFIGLLPFLFLLRWRRLATPELKRVFALLGLWLLNQLITDAYRQTELQDRMRGAAGILVFGAELACLAILLGRSNSRKVVFFTAFATGLLVMARLRPGELVEDDPWKFGYAMGTIELAILISSFFYARRRYVPALAVLAGIISVNLLQNYRSAVLEILVTAVLVFPLIPDRIGKLRILPRKGNPLRVVVVVTLAMIGGWSAGKLVGLVSQSGIVSSEAQEKNESEARAGSLLFGGRPEFFVGLRAAAESPLIGYGSWPRDMRFIELQNDLMQEYGLKVDLKDIEAEERGLIPTHSHVVGAWVWAGILGATFWVYVLWLMVRGILRVSIVRPVLAPLLCWLMIVLFWDTLFSPFGSFERMYAALTIVIAVDLLDSSPTSASGDLPRPSRRWTRRAWRRSVPLRSVAGSAR